MLGTPEDGETAQGVYREISLTMKLIAADVSPLRLKEYSRLTPAATVEFTASKSCPPPSSRRG